MTDSDSGDAQNLLRQKRLARINQKGWEVAQRLSDALAKKEVDLSTLDLDLRAGPWVESKSERLRRYLDTINRARARLHTESYGRCDLCGAPFSSGQLDDTPWVDTCQTCAAAAR